MRRFVLAGLATIAITPTAFALTTTYDFETPTAGDVPSAYYNGVGYSYIGPPYFTDGYVSLDGVAWGARTGIVNGAYSGLNPTGASANVPAAGPSGYGGSQYAFLQGQGAYIAITLTLLQSAVVSVDWLYGSRVWEQGYTFGGTTSDLFGIYALDPGATGSVPATVTMAGNTYSEIAGTSFSTTDGQDFTTDSFTYALGPGTYELIFANLTSTATNDTTDQTVYLDNINISVPEPVSLTLLASGMTGLAAVRRRRR